MSNVGVPSGTCRLTLLSIFMTALLLGTFTSARAEFGTPVTLSHNGLARAIRLGLDGAGNALVVWLQEQSDGERIVARRRLANGTLSQIIKISEVRNSLSSPQLAINSSGDAIIAWANNGVIQARTLSFDNVLGQIRTLTQTRIFPFYVVAIDSVGNAVAVWNQSWNRLSLRTLSSTGALGPKQEVAKLTGAGVYDPQIVLDPDGQGIVVWHEYRDPDDKRVYSRTISTGGALGPATFVSEGLPVVESPYAARDGEGNTIVTWVGGAQNSRVQARRISSAGVLSGIVDVVKKEADVIVEFPQVEMNAAGQAVFAWARSLDNKWTIQGRSFSPTDELGPVIKFATVGLDARAGRIGIDQAGNSVKCYSSKKDYAEARTLSSGGDLGPVQRLSDNAEFGSETCGVLPNGTAFAAWAGASNVGVFLSVGP